MGEVYRAEDTKLKRVVALKRLANNLRSDGDSRRRFLEEAEKVSRVCDTHVAALYDVLEEQGEMFLVMEYVEGQTLRQRLETPLTIGEFFEIAMQCAEALAAAHDLGLVHCDVKPENVMLTEHGQVKILDFGVSKHLPRSDKSSTMESTALAGTPAYMSPEKLLQELPDGRADVFSLGVMFYEMLTGHHPFLAGSFLLTADRIRNEIPVSIRVFNPQVPAQLEALISRAMAKRRQQRYASAGELFEDLRRIQAGLDPKPIPVESSNPASRRWIWWAVILSLLVGLAGFTIYRITTKSPPILSERGWVLIGDFDSRGDESIPDAGIREGLTIALQQSRYVNVFPRTRVYDVLARMKKPDVSRIDEKLGREICERENLRVLIAGSIERVGNVFQITVRGVDPSQGNLLFAESERFDRRDQVFDRADVLAKRVRQDLGESLGKIENTSRPMAKVTTTSLEALQLYSQAVDAMAQANLERARALLTEAIKLDPDFAMAHMLLGTYFSWVVGKNEKAVAEYQRAHELREGVTDREQRRIDAFYFSSLERYDEAADALRVLVSLYPDDAEAHAELASAYYDVGQVNAAISELRQVLRLDPFAVLAYRNIVLYLARQGSYDEAAAAFHEAEQRGIQTPELYWGMGLVHLGRGNVAAAREAFVRLGQGPAADRDLEELYRVIADLYEGKLDSASSELRRQLQSTPHTEGLQLVRRYLLGRILLSQSRKPEAALQADQMLHAPSSTLQTSDLLQAGVLYARAGELRKARWVLARLDQSRQSSPSSWADSSFHNLEGEIHIAEANMNDAQISFTAAARALPQAASHLGLARIYQEQSDPTSAAEELEKVIMNGGEILQNDFPPDLALAHFQLAYIYQQTNRKDLAITHCREMLRMWQHADDGRLLREAKTLFTEMTRDSQNSTTHNQQ